MDASRPEGRRAARLPVLLRLLLPALVLAAAGTTGIPAQEPAEPVLDGRVLKSGEPWGGAEAVLHRVAVDEAGEIDTVQVAADGRFSFRLPSVPDPGGRGEIYFASVRHQGILYFGPAIHEAVQLDSLYTVQVHDTAVVEVGGADLRVDVRYVVAEPVEGAWQITDLLQVTHPGDRTLVPGPEERPVWSYPLPEGIRDFQVGSGDLPAEAATLAEGRFEVTAPLPPGERQFVVRYLVDDLDLTIPLPGRVEQMEVLVQEPAPDVRVTGLQPREPLSLDQGPGYLRFAGSGIQAASVTVQAGDPGGTGAIPVEWLAAAMALLLAAAGAYAIVRGQGSPSPSPAGGPVPGGGGTGAPERRGGSAAEAPGSAGPDRRSLRDTLILEVARIDASLESADLDPQAAGSLREERARIIRRLQNLG